VEARAGKEAAEAKCLNRMEKDKFDACLALAEFSGDRFDSRRDYEWKVTVGFWTLLAVSIAFLFEKSVRIPWWFIPVIIVLHCVWLRGVNVGHRNDVRRAFHFRQEAEFCLLHDDHVIVESPAVLQPSELAWWFGFLGNWATLFETLTTTALTLHGWLHPNANWPNANTFTETGLICQVSYHPN
jgi:hypothetical protein